MEAAEAAEAERVAALRADGSKARRNRSGLPFDPLTLGLRDTPEAAALQLAEDAIRARATARAAALNARGRSTGYNIVSGE